MLDWRFRGNRLKEAQIHDVVVIWNSAALKLARDAFVNIVFSEAFTVHCKAFNAKHSPVIAVLIENHWLKWQKDVYDWLKQFGVCPYMLHNIPGAPGHKVPVVPDRSSGYITTGLDDKMRQYFHWRYHSNDGFTINVGMAGSEPERGKKSPFQALHSPLTCFIA